jgi:hypothetical protein
MALNRNADIFEEWLRTNPAPDLQALVNHWGGYHKVPQVAWDDFYSQNEKWESARLDRLYGHHTWKIRNELNAIQGRPSRRARPNASQTRPR